MSDPTEATRRSLIANGTPEEILAVVQANGGPIWETKELQEEFTVKGFLAPFVAVTRKSDGVTGTLMFTHWPRYYFMFVSDDEEVVA